MPDNLNIEGKEFNDDLIKCTLHDLHSMMPEALLKEAIADHIHSEKGSLDLVIFQEQAYHTCMDSWLGHLFRSLTLMSRALLFTLKQVQNPAKHF